MVKNKFFYFAVTSIFLCGNAAAGEFILVMNSESGDYIGQGKYYEYSLEDMDFISSRNYDNGVRIWMNDYSHENPEYISWDVNFAAPDDVELTKGFYQNATRFPFQSISSPGLSVTGLGRGCNTLTGNFDVLEANYDFVSGDIEAVASYI